MNGKSSLYVVLMNWIVACWKGYWYQLAIMWYRIDNIASSWSLTTIMRFYLEKFRTILCLYLEGFRTILCLYLEGFRTILCLYLEGFRTILCLYLEGFRTILCQRWMLYKVYSIVVKGDRTVCEDNYVQLWIPFRKWKAKQTFLFSHPSLLFPLDGNKKLSFSGRWEM
jgi:hypothetical protein